MAQVPCKIFGSERGLVVTLYNLVHIYDEMVQGAGHSKWLIAKLFRVGLAVEARLSHAEAARTPYLYSLKMFMHQLITYTRLVVKC